MVTKRTRRTFFCEVCGTEYGTRKEAQGCESMPAENAIFTVGAGVDVTVDGRYCGRKCSSFRPCGEVVERLLLGNGRGDVSLDACCEPDNRLLQALVGQIHLFMYIVAYRCPDCGREEQLGFYAHELVRVASRQTAGC